MSTLAARLDHHKLWFFENGGTHIYNELKRFANADGDDVINVLGVATYGDSDYVTHCVPDVVESAHETRPVGLAFFPTVRNGGEPPTPTV